jgi:hypothetical protein
MTSEIGEPPVCVYCKRGTTPARLVKVWVRLSTQQRFYACSRCAARYDGKTVPSDPLVNRKRIIPSLSARLAEWNALGEELDRLFARLRSEPRAISTMEVACSVWNSLSCRATYMTLALVDPMPGAPDEAGDQVRVLRWHVARLARALERDPLMKGRRGDSGMKGRNLRLADTVASVRAAYEREQLEELML